MRVARAALAAGLVACAAPAPQAPRRPLDLWPFVVRDARPVAGIATTRAAGPFFESWTRERGPDEGMDETGWTLRPLVASRSSESSELELLYPLGGIHRDAEGTRVRVTPLVDHVFRRDEGTAEEDARGWTFLLAFGGRTRRSSGSPGRSVCQCRKGQSAKRFAHSPSRTSEPKSGQIRSVRRPPPDPHERKGHSTWMRS